MAMFKCSRLLIVALLLTLGATAPAPVPYSRQNVDPPKGMGVIFKGDLDSLRDILLQHSQQRVNAERDVVDCGSAAKELPEQSAQPQLSPSEQVIVGQSSASQADVVNSKSTLDALDESFQSSEREEATPEAAASNTGPAETNANDSKSEPSSTGAAEVPSTSDAAVPEAASVGGGQQSVEQDSATSEGSAPAVQPELTSEQAVVPVDTPAETSELFSFLLHLAILAFKRIFSRITE